MYWIAKLSCGSNPEMTPEPAMLAWVIRSIASISSSDAVPALLTRPTPPAIRLAMHFSRACLGSQWFPRISLASSFGRRFIVRRKDLLAHDRPSPSGDACMADPHALRSAVDARPNGFWYANHNGAARIRLGSRQHSALARCGKHRVWGVIGFSVGVATASGREGLLKVKTSEAEPRFGHLPFVSTG